MAEGQIKKGRTGDTVMELAFLFSSAVHQNNFHPLPLDNDVILPWQGHRQLLRSPAASPLLCYLNPSAGCSEVALPTFPCLALISGEVSQGCLAQQGPSRVPCTPKGQVALQRAAPLHADLGQLDPKQPLVHHDVAQGKLACNPNTYLKSL